ncbi:MAG TPA: transcriptional repressor LexA [Syntrophorhabdaceae bacterium]|jgi:repressor LexA|nr:transcriptional repressor LexA [Syntrophorhabdaceae bacterium]
MLGLTETQKRIFEFLKDYVKKQGYPPTVREIGAHFHILWPAARNHLKSLEKKGVININPAISRGIEIKGFKTAGEHTVPVAGRIRAGDPILAIEEIETHIVVDPALFPAKDTFSLRVVGDSMKDAGILDGDYVIVKQQSTVEHGDIGIILIGNEATVKRVLFRQGKVILKPENNSMEPREYSVDDVTIAGKVIGLIRNKV